MVTRKLALIPIDNAETSKIGREEKLSFLIIKILLKSLDDQNSDFRSLLY